MAEAQRNELIRKYQWAGKIRFISFFLLFIFLLLMKVFGGYAYLNPALYFIFFVEILLNQPYGFILNRVNLRRFQYFQMLADIIAISWVLYYMGGLEAPVVNLAYYAVILWAGVVAGFGAALFAVLTCAFFLTSIVLLEQFGILPRVSFLNYSMPTTQAVTILIGNVAFLFAFGYFSVRSSEVIGLLQRKRQEESLRYTHRLSITGYLVGKTAHDIQGCLAGIRGSVQILLSLGKQGEEEKKFLKSIEDFEKRGAGLIHRLAGFSQKPANEHMPVDINSTIEEALELTEPLVKYSRMTVEKEFERNIPLIAADKGQLQEVFVAMILNSLDSVAIKPKGGALTIKANYLNKENTVEIIFSDTGIGIKQGDLKRIGEPFFSTKKPGAGSGMGLATAYDIVKRHNGKIDVKSAPGEGATFIIQLPITRQKITVNAI